MRLTIPKARISIDETEFLLAGLRDLYVNASVASRKEIKGLAGTVLYVASETRRADFTSCAATNLWEQNNMNGDIKNLTIRKQRANKKKYPFLNDLMLEHCTPLSMIFSEIFEQNKDIKPILESQLLTAWITKNEDCRLNQNGYKSARPNGWRKCYAECDIKI